MTAQQLMTEALALPDDERRKLAEVLLDSVPPAQPDPDVAAAWEAEIARRVAMVDRGEMKVVDGPTFIEGLREKLRRVHAK